MTYKATHLRETSELFLRNAHNTHGIAGVTLSAQTLLTKAIAKDLEQLAQHIENQITNLIPNLWITHQKPGDNPVDTKKPLSPFEATPSPKKDHPKGW